MKAIDSPFTKIINGTTQFVIPVFQRDYTWDAETQCAQLWRDVLHAAGTGNERGHFLGSIVYVATGDSLAGFRRWLLIDGQLRQRHRILRRAQHPARKRPHQIDRQILANSLDVLRRCIREQNSRAFCHLAKIFVGHLEK
jgi:hypothetical protein